MSPELRKSIRITKRQRPVRQMQKRALGCCYTHRAAAQRHHWLTMIRR